MAPGTFGSLVGVALYAVFSDLPAFLLGVTLLGLAFLWPGRRGPARIRNWVLLLFGWTTYAVATVPTFGWVLMTFGAAQCRRDERVERFLLTLSCGLILIYSYVRILSLLRPLLPAPS